jgi:hypothetical protein
MPPAPADAEVVLLYRELRWAGLDRIFEEIGELLLFLAPGVYILYY